MAEIFEAHWIYCESEIRKTKVRWEHCCRRDMEPTYIALMDAFFAALETKLSTFDRSRDSFHQLILLCRTFERLLHALAIPEIETVQNN